MIKSTLTPKQQRFVEEYLIDLNGTQAAIRAGYSKKTAMEQGYQLLQKTSVQAAIQGAIKDRAEETKLDAQYVLINLKKIVERCMQAVPVTEKKNGERVETGVFRFDSAGANKALELIGKHNKMFTNVLEVNPYADLTEEQLRERIRVLHEKLGL